MLAFNSSFSTMETLAFGDLRDNGDLSIFILPLYGKLVHHAWFFVRFNGPDTSLVLCYK